MLVIEPIHGQGLTHWSQINWSAVEATVRRLQGRIYRAAADGQAAKVKNLQKLLVRSMSAKLKAIRQVTQENVGKHTPGVDGVVCDTPEARWELLLRKIQKKELWIPLHPGYMQVSWWISRACLVAQVPRRLSAQHPVTGTRYAAAELTPRAKRGRRGGRKGACRVGRAVALTRPLTRTVRADFPHTAPPSMWLVATGPTSGP